MEGRIYINQVISNSKAPIFILGILPRSGTNYLNDLIRAHPDCWSHQTIWEDYFVHFLDLLKKYTDSVSWWKWREGQVDESTKVELCKYIGDGIINFLSSDLPEGKRLVTKTPSIHNIHLFQKYFPDSCMLILVRDGRSVVESLVRTFNGPYEKSIHRWANAAKEIKYFENNYKNNKSRYLIVKYEDLYENTEAELKKIFCFLQLDVHKYDFTAAKNKPVRGSSTFKSNENKLTWQPLEKTVEFNPINRWSNWSRRYHEMFNYLGGEQLQYFGYKQVSFDNNKLYWWLWVRFRAVNRVRRFYSHLILLKVKDAVEQCLGKERVKAMRKYFKCGIK